MKIVKRDLRKVSNKDSAKINQSFFKTGKGQYGEGDIFLGTGVPQQRKIAKEAVERFSLDNIQELLNSKIHDERMVALLILIEKYKKGDADDRKIIFDFYLANSRNINNWDLVDLSASKIVGDYLLNKKDRRILVRLAKSGNLWEKRIGIVSTFAFIRAGEVDDCLKISKILLKDKHDLIHKAVGWMLREVGKKDRKVLEDFLRENYSDLPRTTLRYAIERFDEGERKGFLLGNI